MGVRGRDEEEAMGTGSCFPFQGYNKTLLRLRLRKKQVSDVQKVLQGGEQEIQFEDFTNTLREWVISDPTFSDIAL